jgi:hypothetical protein
VRGIYEFAYGCEFKIIQEPTYTFFGCPDLSITDEPLDPGERKRRLLSIKIGRMTENKHRMSETV